MTCKQYGTIREARMWELSTEDDPEYLARCPFCGILNAVTPDDSVDCTCCGASIYWCTKPVVLEELAAAAVEEKNEP